MRPLLSGNMSATRSVVCRLRRSCLPGAARTRLEWRVEQANVDGSSSSRSDASFAGFHNGSWRNRRTAQRHDGLPRRMVLMVGILYFRLHALPEHMAHGTSKVQLQIVGVLGLLSLFTHNHIYWIAGLLLALIPFPDFSTPLKGMAESLAKMAGAKQLQPKRACSTLADYCPAPATCRRSKGSEGEGLSHA